jgi:hypothetical protein
VDAVAGHEDPGELLAVDVQQFARPLAFVAGDLAALDPRLETRAAVTAQDRVHRRGGDTGCPTDDVRPGLQLRPCPQDGLLDLPAHPARRMMRTRRPILESLTSAVPVDPLRAGLAGATNDRGRGRDRHPRTNKRDKPATLTLAERGTTMQLH